MSANNTDTNSFDTNDDEEKDSLNKNTINSINTKETGGPIRFSLNNISFKKNTEDDLKISCILFNLINFIKLKNYFFNSKKYFTTNLFF